MSDLCDLPATVLAGLIKKGELSARQLVSACLERIEQWNPVVNAVVTVTAEQALEQARLADEQQARGQATGRLHGLPVVHKDLFETRGVRTTYGSTVFRDFVPTSDAAIVERQRLAGAIMVGKSNTPEFGAGSQTFNRLFGATRNPYDLSRTCGGSSGGAAVALACGMAALADGTDTGGSLRNPASFCNVVGFRPSAGRVALWPDPMGWFTLNVAGPMGRTVEDVALLMSVIAGPDRRSPISLPEPGERFLEPLERDFRGTRLAWSPTLGGLPVERPVLDVLENSLAVFHQAGCVVEQADPDLSDADEVFCTLRAWRFAWMYSDLIDRYPGEIKETIVWNVEQGKRLSGQDVARAEALRTRIYHRMLQFFQRFDFLLAPVVQVLPFDVQQPYVQEINGIRMGSYLDWMKSCYWISATGLPAISVPAGFSSEGLPVGLQIVGPPLGDFAVLQLAYFFQQATEYWRRRPSLAAN
ncbi:MAG: amidase [Pirellulaceae bacterium]|nr:MAG: amidase [Pirellulaceae bacterium]